MNAVESNVDGGTLDKPPLRALVSGVRTADTMTTSLGLFLLVLVDDMIRLGSAVIEWIRRE